MAALVLTDVASDLDAIENCPAKRFQNLEPPPWSHSEWFLSTSSYGHQPEVMQLATELSAKKPEPRLRVHVQGGSPFSISTNFHLDYNYQPQCAAYEHVALNRDYLHVVQVGLNLGRVAIISNNNRICLSSGHHIQSRHLVRSIVL